MEDKGGALDLWGSLSTGVDKLPQRSLCREVFMYVLLVSDDRKKCSAWELGFGTEAFLSYTLVPAELF